MKIRYILQSYITKPNRGGSMEIAFSFTDCETGNKVGVKLGGCISDSNVRSIMLYWKEPATWENQYMFHYTCEENIPQAVFNGYTLNFYEKGIDAKELVAWIKKVLEIRE